MNICEKSVFVCVPIRMHEWFDKSGHINEAIILKTQAYKRKLLPVSFSLTSLEKIACNSLITAHRNKS